MSLAAGTRLGPYEIQSAIGAGGMGEVYKARDTRLHRTVAIKVVSGDAAADPARRRRFEQEARAASALNHPHICVLHDIGSQDGIDYLVMEHLEGQTLAERLARGPLPAPQAIEYAVQVADALAKAHHEGIVHRDLKPSNVMLTKSGAKLLDFGLARLAEPATAGDRSATATTSRVIVGTIPYMAPEQVQGLAIDARTDLFALGAVMYEMLSGRPAFEGETAARVSAAILERDPPPIAAERAVPPPLDQLVRQCLAKSPDDRPDTAHDVANQLRWVKETGGVAALTGAPPRRRLRSQAILVSACLLAGASVGTLVMWFVRPNVPLVTRPSLDVRPAEEVTTGPAVVGGNPSQTPGGSRTAFAWTPNGRALVFIGRQAGVQRLYVRPLDAAEARPIPNTDGARMLAVSPDGRWVAFWANGKITKVRLDGSPATEASSYTAPEPPRGLTWGDGGLFYDSFPPEAVIWQIPGGQGARRQVTQLLQGDFQHSLPWPLPGGRTILYTLRKRVLSWGGEEIVAQILATGERKTLLRDAVDARYVASGHLVFLRQGRLCAVPFDPERVEKTGDEVVLETVAQALTGGGSDVSGAGQYALSSTGHLAWVPSSVPSHPNGWLVTVDRQGRATRLPAEPRPYARVRLSPDGRQLAVTISALDEIGLWVYDLRRSNLTPRAVHRGEDVAWPAWSRDNRQIAFLQINNGFFLVTKPADSDPSARPTVWWPMAPLGPCPASFSREGDILAVHGYDDIVVITQEGNVRPLIATPGTSERYPDLSPDGRWLAYASDASGRMEVYVTPYPDVRPADAQPVSVGGGDSPAWHPNGRELFFLRPPTPTGTREMMAADFSPGPPLRVGRPHLLFEFDPQRLRFWAFPLRNYQVGSDGRFYTVESRPEAVPVVTRIDLFPNWFEELKAKVPVK